MPFDRKHYDLLVAHGLCPGCKGTPRPGRKFCPECSKKGTDYARQWRKDHPGRDAKWARKLRGKRKLRGDCTRCGKKAERGAYCAACLAYSASLRNPNPKKGYTCSLCKGTEQPARHDRRSCPLRFKVDIIAYASARQAVEL